MNQLIDCCLFTTFSILLVGNSYTALAQREGYVFAKATSGVSPILKKKKDRQQTKENARAEVDIVVKELEEEDSFADYDNVVENFTWQKEGKCVAYENYYGWSENCELPSPTKTKKQHIEPADCSNKVWLSDSIALDSKYLFAHHYFNIWDSKSVDPYGYDIKNFKETDSITFQLYDETQGKYWSAPIYKTVRNSEFGFRKYRWHHGIDLDLEIGDSVYAAFDGVVRIAKFNRGGYGWYVLIRHENGLETLYGHLTKYLVKPGQEVKAGELIGLGGNTGRSTGPHLHFEVRYQGQAFNPEAMYDFDNDSLKTQHFTLTHRHYQDQQSRSKAQFHRVRNGDTLGKLASMYGTPITTICRLNGITKKTVLRAGRNIRVR